MASGDGRDGDADAAAAARQAEVFARLMAADPANQRCAECGAPRPTWASVPLGIFLCLACASRHRGYGVQASFVRSLTLDRWQVPQQTEFLRVGGNARYRAYCAANDHALPDEHRCACAVCARYRALLAADVRAALRIPDGKTTGAEDGTEEEEEEENACPLAQPRGGVQCAPLVHGTPADSIAIDAGGSGGGAARGGVQRRVVGLARADIDEEEERRLFGESLRDSDDDADACDCCRACACTIL